MTDEIDTEQFLTALSCYGSPEAVTYVDVEINDDRRAFDGVMSRAHDYGYVFKEIVDIDTDADKRVIRLQPVGESDVDAQ